MSSVKIEVYASLKMLILLLMLVFLRTNEATDDIKQFLSKTRSLDLYADIASKTVHNNSYCNICCIDIQKNTIGKSCGSHTLCRYPENVTGPACKGYVRVRFTDAEKQLIVDLHNSLRNQVALGVVSAGNPGPQPKASNMRMLEWSEELALIAERWAAQCVYGKDLCRDLEKFPVGQNIARGNLATKSDLSLVMIWFDEAKFLSADQVLNYDLSPSGKKCARYTQLIWADSYLLGCARAMFQTSKTSRITYTEHLICNYGPTGNIPNQPIYKVGEPCTECQEGTACKYPEYNALCAAEMQDEFNDYLDLALNEACCLRFTFKNLLYVVVGFKSIAFYFRT